VFIKKKLFELTNRLLYEIKNLKITFIENVSKKTATDAMILGIEG